MGIIDSGNPKYSTLKFSLVREIAGIEGAFDYDPRTPERSADLQRRLSSFSIVDVRFFYANALLSVGDKIRVVQSPEQADSVIRVAGLWYPQVHCVEEALLDFNLGVNSLSSDGVFVRNIREGANSEAWLKLRAFVAHGLKCIPEHKRPEAWKYFPIEATLREADRRDIVYNDSIDHKTETALMAVRNGHA